MANPDYSSIGRRSKRRGKTYERRCAEILHKFTGIGFRSTPGSGGFNKFGGVTIREDLFCGDLICDRNDFRFCVEAKNRESFTFESILKNPVTAPFTSWWYQCLEDAKAVSLSPLMFFKPDKQADCAVFALSDWEHFQFTDNQVPPHFVVNAYNFQQPVVLRISSRRGTSQVQVSSLATPVIVEWKSFTAACNPTQLFKG